MTEPTYALKAEDWLATIPGKHLHAFVDGIMGRFTEEEREHTKTILASAFARRFYKLAHQYTKAQGLKREMVKQWLEEVRYGSESRRQFVSECLANGVGN